MMTRSTFYAQQNRKWSRICGIHWNIVMSLTCISLLAFATHSNKTGCATSICAAALLPKTVKLSKRALRAKTKLKLEKSGII